MTGDQRQRQNSANRQPWPVHVTGAAADAHEVTATGRAPRDQRDYSQHFHHHHHHRHHHYHYFYYNYHYHHRHNH